MCYVLEKEVVADKEGIVWGIWMNFGPPPPSRPRPP